MQNYNFFLHIPSLAAKNAGRAVRAAPLWVFQMKQKLLVDELLAVLDNETLVRLVNALAEYVVHGSVSSGSVSSDVFDTGFAVVDLAGGYDGGGGGSNSAVISNLLDTSEYYFGIVLLGPIFAGSVDEAVAGSLRTLSEESEHFGKIFRSEAADSYEA